MNSKIRGWAENIKNEVKKAFGIDSSSKVMRDEVGKYLSLGIADGLRENDKAVTKAFSQMLEKLDYRRKFDIISEDEYYRSLENLRDRYFTVGTEGWVKYTEKIYAYQQKLLEAEQEKIIKEAEYACDMYSDVSKYAVSRMDEVLKKQQALQKNLSETGSLYTKNTALINGQKYEYYSMSDFDKDIENIENYAHMLENLSLRAEKLGVDKGTVEGFFSVIKELDFKDASGLMTAMGYASDTEFSSYINGWAAKENISGAVAAREYEKEFKQSTDEAYVYMKEKLESAGYEIPEGFYISGSLSAQKFGEGFASSLDAYLEPVRDRIESFKSEISGNVYQNTSNVSYNISASNDTDVVEEIKRHETVKRLSGI